jgi:bifunctional DNA-binding transcriptional regulator/antitoxin component of YhaV-PrlF toxin-antitoxin module
MTATLTIDEQGRLTLPESLQRVLGLKPGMLLRAEVSEGRMEIVCGDDEPPLITTFREDGLPDIPDTLTAGGADKIVEAIKHDREARMAKLAGI